MKARISEKELFRRFGGDVVVLHGCDYDARRAKFRSDFAAAIREA